VLALFVTIQALSGTALVFRDELEPLVHSELRVAARGERASIQALHDVVSARYPTATMGRAEFPESETQAVLFKLKEGKKPILVAVDPFSAAIVREGGLGDWPFEWIFQVHYELLAGPTGHFLIGVEGLALLFLAITGPIVWWPGRKRIRQGLKVKIRGKADPRWRTLHRSGGAIAAVFLIVSSTTGAAMVWKEELRAALAPIAAAPGKPTPKIAEQPGRPHVPLDALVASARRQYATPLRQIRFSSGGRAVAVFLDGDRSVRADGTNQIYYNVYDGSEIGRYVAGEMPPASEAIDWLFTVHTGLWGGVATRLLLLLVGASLIGLTLTGPWLWWSRTRRRRRSGAATAKPRLADDAR
jgi:uncharacterized iron-regulated membrane protein